MSEGERPRVDVRRDRCPYCHEAIPATPERTACNACGAWHHQACWDEGARCSACGFERARASSRERAPAPDAGERSQPAGPTLRCGWWSGCAAPAASRLGGNVLCKAHARESLRWRSRALLVLAALALLGAIGLAALGSDLIPVAVVFGAMVPVSAALSWALARKAERLARGRDEEG